MMSNGSENGDEVLRGESGGGLDMVQMGRDGEVGGMREEGGGGGGGISMLPPNSRTDDALVLQQVSLE